MKTRYGFLVLIAILLLASLTPGRAFSQSQTGQAPLTITIPGGSSPTGATNVVAPAAGGSGFLMLHASDFMPESNSMVFIRSLVLQTLPTSPAGVGYRYTAPVELPQGATITGMTLYYRDNDPANLISLTLWRMPVPGSGAGGVMTINTPLAGTTGDTFAQATPVVTTVVDNQANAYYLEATIPPNASVNVLFLAAARVDYTYTAALPAIMH